MTFYIALLVLLCLLITVGIGFVIISRHFRQINIIANGGMIASSRRRREMIHEAGRQAMEEFRKAAK